MLYINALRCYQYGDVTQGGVTTRMSVTSRANLSTGSVEYGPSVPGYPELLGRSDLTTTLSGVREDVDVPHTTYGISQFSSSGGQLGYQTWGQLYHSLLPNGAPKVPPDFLGELDTRYRASIYQAQSGPQTGVLLGELRETLRMIRSPLRAVSQLTRNYGRSAKRLRRRLEDFRLDKRLALSEAASLWLAYSFGVKPFVADIENHIEHVSDLLKKFENISVGAKLSHESKTKTRVVIPFGVQFSFRAYCLQTDTLTYEGKARGLLQEELKTTSAIVGSFGFRVRDFVPTLYELTPFSFLVDYFTNVGKVVNAAFACYDSHVYGMMTAEAKLKRTFHVREVLWASGGVSPSASGSLTPGSSERSSVVRVRSLGYPTSVRWESPSGRQYFNVAALLASFY